MFKRLRILPLFIAASMIWPFLSSLTAQAQCPANVMLDHMTLTYEFSPLIDGDATTMHVRVTVQGASSDQFILRMPGQASKDTVSPWINLRAESTETKIGVRDERGARVVHFSAGKAAVFSYDLHFTRRFS